LTLNLFVSCRFERAEQAVAGIVDQHVNAAEFGKRCRNSRFDRSSISYVKRKHRNILKLSQIRIMRWGPHRGGNAPSTLGEQFGARLTYTA
jgi:hypothetical protein